MYTCARTRSREVGPPGKRWGCSAPSPEEVGGGGGGGGGGAGAPPAPPESPPLHLDSYSYQTIMDSMLTLIASSVKCTKTRDPPDNDVHYCSDLL